MPRIAASNPLAQALDKRIRAVIDESMENALRTSIRRIVQEELSQLLGNAAAPAAIGTRRVGRPPGRRVQATRAPRATATAAAAGTDADKKCEVAGCKRPYRSQGYCAAHYQAARKYEWPMPAPRNFSPPARPSRGRPPKEAAARGE